ncbi:MAG: tryptophan synthase subunit alpha, partial [Nitrospirota bacterium]|nr:tryptophan synthase subunit alpha [Nitrospirota bacterium]
IRKISDKPVAVGFGVSTRVEGKAVAGVSDGVIIGSAIVIKAQASLDNELRDFLLTLREAIK